MSLLQTLLSLPVGGGSPHAMDTDEQAPPAGTHAVGSEEALHSMQGAQPASSGGAGGVVEKEGSEERRAPQQPAPVPAVTPAGDRPKLSLRERVQLLGVVVKD